VRDFVIMQKRHAFNKLKAKGPNVVGTVTKSQDLVKGRFPRQYDDRLPNTEVNGFKQWDGMIRWRLDIVEVLQQLMLVGVIDYLEDNRNATS